MERNSYPWKADDESNYTRESETDFKCDECGVEFHRPLLAKDSSRGLTQTYYACPRCLTKVHDVENHKAERREEHSTPMKETKKPSAKLEAAQCNHFIGYLKKREKNTPIPEDCLTCEKMLECMVY